MRILYLLLFAFTSAASQKEPASVTESFQLVNDLNAAENRAAIYMCREVNHFWGDFLAEPKPEDEAGTKNFQKRVDSISKYIGGNPVAWKKSLLYIETWEPRVKAKEYVSYHNLNIDKFYASHNRTGVYLYSLPLFDAARKKALVYVWYLSAHGVVLNNYYYCEKENGVWKRRNIVLIGGFNNY
ncbi:hypothetical protein [Flavobacterium selenitireducens]|uniref:hypothetical protein n=1 Tax=Flavobacterium selenitireducens TaxID=2722704 RepID=UPI00168BA21B|nr:hypothetical protein [Flavobacterium selenitireducens]MBD3582447.1 hypothetical protein [Flavobacterium selenitireducens]